MAVKEVIVSADEAVLLSALADHAERRRAMQHAAHDEASALVAPPAAALNARVEFEDLASGRRDVVQLVHPAAADAGRGSISVLSPVGRALLGRRAGQQVDVTLPNGDARELLVLAVAAGD